jgi:hypothetical protein
VIRWQGLEIDRDRGVIWKSDQCFVHFIRNRGWPSKRWLLMEALILGGPMTTGQLLLHTGMLDEIVLGVRKSQLRPAFRKLGLVLRKTPSYPYKFWLETGG